ncbi:MAG: MlaD family protein [Desulfobacteraceae bacterium]
MRTLTFNKGLMILLCLLIFPVLSGCSPFELNIRFDTVKGLKTGDQVIFNQKSIGSVDRIRYTEEGNFLVSVTIQKDFKNAVREDSVFYISGDPSDTQKKAVFMAHESDTGKTLESGKTVKGLPYAPSSAVGIFSDIMDELNHGFDTFIQDMKKLPQSEKYKRFEKELESLGEKMKTAGEKTRDKIRQEIIPQLKKKLEEFKEKGDKEKVEPLEKKLENLQSV